MKDDVAKCSLQVSITVQSRAWTEDRQRGKLVYALETKDFSRRDRGAPNLRSRASSCSFLSQPSPPPVTQLSTLHHNPLFPIHSDFDVVFK